MENLKNVQLAGYRFVEHVEDKIETLNYNLASVFNGGYHGQYDNVLNYGYIKIMGYKYEVKHLLKRYIIDTKNGIYKYYFPNKTIARKNLTYANYGKIYNIIEIKG